MPARPARTVLICLAALVVIQAPRVASESAVVALTRVNVIPMDRERVLTDQTILVQDGRITRVGPAAEVQVPEGARRMELTGRYAMPALAEMHAHIPGGDAPDAAIERVLYLYVANGIGTIRGMLGHPRHLPLRERASRGELISPWIYTSGPSLNGNTVPTAEAGAKAAREQKAAGYDFLKIHPGILCGPFDGLAAAANEVSIGMAGHVPADVGLHRALEVPYASIDHLDGYVEALARSGAPGTQFFGLNLVDHADTARIQELVTATRTAGVANVPTQALFEHWVGPDDPEEMARWPEMRYVSRTDLDSWIENKKKLTAGVTVEQRRRFLEIRRQLIKALHDGGTRLLLGADAPQVWNVPGFSVHRELRYLVDAGLTPYQALESGTRNVATYFGTASERGTLESGKRADIVVLEGNPLEDIGQSGRISAVIVGGRVLTREALDKRLKELQER